MLQTFHRQLEEPGYEEGEEIGAEQREPSKKITLPACEQVAIEPGQFADDAPRDIRHVRGKESGHVHKLSLVLIDFPCPVKEFQQWCG